MNSIFWKGVRSTTIPGLLVCELPPISKPRMRINETVIDGRDGSIVEELGYETYTKTIVIGLRSAFDINEVIKYFTGEGDLVFSNEIDKVYKARITEGIDFERLLHFKRATVKFLCQPFKYKRDEVFKETEVVTASGNSMHLADSYAIKKFKTYGYTRQNGTPDLDVPADIEVVTESVEVKAIGKNVLNYAKNLKAESNGLKSVLNADGSITTTGIPTVDYAGISYLVLNDVLVDGKTYTISQKNGGKVFLQINIKDNANGTVQYVSNGKGSFTVDLSKYTYAANIQVSSLQIVGTSAINETNFYQIEEGTVATDFEPYKESVVTYSLGDEFMGEQDYIENGVLIKNTKKIVFTGDEEIVLETNNEYTRFIISGVSDVKNIRQRLPIVSTRFYFSKDKSEAGVGFIFGGKFYLYPPNNVQSVDAFREWLSLNTPEIYYPIENAERVTVGENPQAFMPSTSITNDKGLEMEITYFRPFEVFNEGIESSRPLMVLKGSGTVEISVNGTGIFSYTFPEGENEVVIDSEKEDAYLGSVLKNRNMNGEFPILLPKTNKIEWSGDVESIEILPRSRWL